MSTKQSQFTAIRIDREVHEHLFCSKERPGEPFNNTLRRELGLPVLDGDGGD